MKIAIASSGLGHVSRGIETWAGDTAKALSALTAVKSYSLLVNKDDQREIGERLEVTLFAAEKVSGFRFQVSGLQIVVLPCLKRNSPKTQRLTALTPRWAWRWGLKSAYGWEQLSFWRHLWPKLRRGKFDILHVQDPMLAYWCRKFRRLGLVKTKEILAHGTEEPVEFLKQFEYVQHLAPWHLEQAELALSAQRSEARGQKPEFWAEIPNFVDCGVFHPVNDSRFTIHDSRERFGIPSESFVIGTAAAVKKRHKRIDYLIKEFAAFLEIRAHSRSFAVPFLIIAGAKTDQSEELVALAEKLAPGRIKILFDIPLKEMPDFYRALDVFMLTSLFEMMPISVLEALASGVPVIANNHPVLRWMIGARTPGGSCIDMSKEGELAGFLEQITPEWIQDHGKNARKRAEQMFSKDAVIDQYMGYYRQVCDWARKTNRG